MKREEFAGPFIAGGTCAVSGVVEPTNVRVTVGGVMLQGERFVNVVVVTIVLLVPRRASWTGVDER